MCVMDCCVFIVMGMMLREIGVGLKLMWKKIIYVSEIKKMKEW
jgi:hypothetical protein